jgi:zinc transport system substrate-binding protein
MDRRITSTAAQAGHLWCLSALMLILWLPGIACSAPGGVEQGTMTVAVTLLPQAGFVEAVGGERVDVVVMVPPGASPHTYELTPEQMVRLSQAEVYVKVGTPVEFELVWMDRLTSANDDMLIVDCSHGIDLIHSHEEEEGANHDHHGVDPHIWLSVSNAIIMVENICEGLMAVDSGNEAYYRANCAAYVAQLRGLQEDLAESMASLEGGTFIVFHPSFGYFARDYGLTQMAVEQGGGEPDAQYIVRLVQEAKAQGARVVFASPQLSTRSAEVIAAEIDADVVIIDPLAEDYIPNMRAIAEAISQVVQ